MPNNPGARLADNKRNRMRIPSIPKPLGAVLSALPQHPPAVVAAVFITLLWGDVLNGTRLPDALGKVICINVRDAGLRLRFRVLREGIAACRAVAPDLLISAETNDFLALALRAEDADSLFFSRRLVMEGDTELGLLVRNTLEALDTRALDSGLPAPAAVWRALALQLHGLRGGA